MIECFNLCYSVKGNGLIHDVSWHFAEGKISAIIGANGAGKSTLMKTLLGSIKPDLGCVQFRGKPLKKWSLGELAVCRAYMSQSGANKIGITVLEYLLLARVHYVEHPSVTEQFVTQVIETLALHSLAEKRVDELSGGEYQRVELARAWCQLVSDDKLNGKLLLLDEPASALDINQSQKLYLYLQKFVEDGGTVIVVEHDLNTAAKYCDDMLLLKQGQCIAAGGKSSVFTEANLNNCFNVNGRLMHDEVRNVMSFSL